jgi:cobalt-zinc-cadmium efflux system protein
MRVMDFEGASKHDHSRMASIRRLTITLGLLVGYMVVEVVGGLLANSLSLLADAGHMLTDAGAVGLALLAIWLAGKPRRWSGHSVFTAPRSWRRWPTR